jgi:hypothetical protein
MSVWTLIYYALLISFWALVIFLGWRAFKRFRNRHYAFAALFALLAFLILWGGLFIGFTPGSRAYADYRMTRCYFGTGFILGKPYLTYDSERDFNGDGYSISVYKLSERTTRKLRKPKEAFFQDLPAKPSFRSHWQSKAWHPTPIIDDDLQFLEFALLERGHDSQLEKAQQLLRRLTHEPEHFYACFYFMHAHNPGDVDFFLLSPKERIFIMVNHNT